MLVQFAVIADEQGSVVALGDKLPAHVEMRSVEHRQRRIGIDVVAAAGERDIVERDLDVGILPIPEASIFRIAYGRAVNDSSERDVVTTPAKRGAGYEILVVSVNLYLRSLAAAIDVELRAIGRVSEARKAVVAGSPRPVRAVAPESRGVVLPAILRRVVHRRGLQRCFRRPGVRRIDDCVAHDLVGDFRSKQSAIPDEVVIACG